MICPIGEPDHENNEVCELYRAKCETDDCNIMDPRCDIETGLGADNYKYTIHIAGLRTEAAATTMEASSSCDSLYEIVLNNQKQRRPGLRYLLFAY